MLDTLATRYSKLPSYILENANTLDLYVMDVALSFEQYQHKKDSKNVSDQYDINTLESIVKQVKHGE